MELGRNRSYRLTGGQGRKEPAGGRNLGLVHAVTRRFEHRGHDRGNWFQIGRIGLMKAIDKFDGIAAALPFPPTRYR